MTEPKIKRKFDKALLDECLIRDEATLVGTYEELKCSTIIVFNCKCGNEYKKKFWICENTSGLFCKSCTKINTDKKRENTNLELFGVKNPMFSDELKKKQEEAIIQSLGVKNPSQSNIIKEKKKATVTKNFKYTNSLASFNPELSKEWHPTKNYRKDSIDGEYFPGSQLSPSEFTYSAGYRAWWLCPNTNCSQKCSHEYQQRIADKIGQNQGCPLCNGNQQRCYHNTLAYLYPELSKEWHPTKNYREDAIEGEYFPGSQISPSELSKGNSSTFWWKCLIGCKDGCTHEWKSQVDNRTRVEGGSKCPYCRIGTTKVCVHQSIGYLYPSLLNEWDYDKNTHLDPYKIPFKSAITANWICKNICSFDCICNNEYESVIHCRTNGLDVHSVQCPKCKYNGVVCEHTSLLSNKLLLNELDYEQHPDIIPEDIHLKNTIKLNWICSKNKKHKWDGSLNHRGKGVGCPFCPNKTETILLDFLKKHYTCNIITQFKLESCKNKRYLPFDFCIPSLKLIIELDGLQHFEQVSNWDSPEKTRENDIYKMKKAEAEGYKVLRIFQEDVYDNDEKWLEENLLPEIKSEDRAHLFITTKEDLYDEHIKAAKRLN